ncbi:hypothetical protein NE237_025019 [Protea cynaroides]|uniref:TmcB/TmcC TPR repeats domain-containing protein n=1 Tax=Protea cynaroides TaxID=273540 RepID=A0A9Q0H435_9MAGN|nr:hypothetical protein NE237_025019 [Protea cynaroides]
MLQTLSPEFPRPPPFSLPPSGSTMKAVLLRTVSSLVQSSMVFDSPKLSFSCASHDSVTAALFSGENKKLSPSLSSPSLHFQMKDKASRSIRRAKSEADVACSLKNDSDRFSKLTSAGYRSFPAMIPEEKEEKLEFFGGGAGKDNKISGGNGDSGDGGGFVTGGSADQSKIAAYYQKMLKANPGDPLLLRNYGQFLHQVEKDAVRAEEYYGRAILASQGDGEVLSLCGKLIWESYRDETRAHSYFQQAVQASPNDCFVMGSYAHFLWDAVEDEQIGAASPLVEAF